MRQFWIWKKKSIPQKATPQTKIFLNLLKYYWKNAFGLEGRKFVILFPPNRKKNTQKKGELFSFFEIFTGEFSHFLVTKKVFLFTKKWLNSAVKISKNEKSSPFFWVFFFLFGGIKKKNSRCSFSKIIQQLFFFY